MRALRIYLGIFVLAGVSAGGAYLLAEKISEPTAAGIAKGSLAAFTMLIGFATYMLKDVQSLDSKDALSPLGLERLRRVQQIAYRRLLWMVVAGIVGFIGASFAAFSEGNALAFIRAFGFVVAMTSLAVLLSLCVTYVPWLFFDLQRTRDMLSDMARSDETRKKQLESLNDSNGKGKS